MQKDYKPLTDQLHGLEETQIKYSQEESTPTISENIGMVQFIHPLTNL